MQIIRKNITIANLLASIFGALGLYRTLGQFIMADNQHNRKSHRSFIATMVAVAWSFIGLRRKKDFDDDVGGLNPVYVIIGGLIGTAIFIAILLTIVNLVVP